MKGNFHVQFLGEGVAATSPPYPTLGWATTQVYPARGPPNADEAGPLQHDPARLKRLEQLVAEVGNLLEDPAQLARGDAVRPCIALGVGRDGGRAIGQQRDVAGELARAVDDDRLRLGRRFVHDGDLARLDDVERHAALPGLENELAVLE